MQSTEDLENRNARREENKSNLKGINGLWEEYDPSELDVTKLFKYAWYQNDQITIARCWDKEKYLPCDMEAEIVSVFCSICNSTKS